jgi:hypothetical protein
VQEGGRERERDNLVGWAAELVDVAILPENGTLEGLMIFNASNGIARTPFPILCQGSVRKACVWNSKETFSCILCTPNKALSLSILKASSENANPPPEDMHCDM